MVELRPEKAPGTFPVFVASNRKTLHPIEQSEAQPDPAGNLDPPAHALPLAKEKWRELAPQLSRLRLLTKVDLDLLENYCAGYAKKRTDDDFLKQHVWGSGRLRSGYVLRNL